MRAEQRFARWIRTPNDTAEQYIKNGIFRIGIENYCFLHCLSNYWTDVNLCMTNLPSRHQFLTDIADIMEDSNNG
jgi:hypothetical protein